MNIHQLNRVIEEFDHVTHYKYDTESNLDNLCDVAQLDERVPASLYREMLDLAEQAIHEEPA